VNNSDKTEEDLGLLIKKLTDEQARHRRDVQAIRNKESNT